MNGKFFRITCNSPQIMIKFGVSFWISIVWSGFSGYLNSYIWLIELISSSFGIIVKIHLGEKILSIHLLHTKIAKGRKVIRDT